MMMMRGIQYFYITDNATWLNNTHKTHCYGSISTMVKRTCMTYLVLLLLLFNCNSVDTRWQQKHPVAIETPGGSRNTRWQ
jgi:hypothetical protein